MNNVRNKTKKEQTKCFVKPYDDLSSRIELVLKNINERNPVKLRNNTPKILVKIGIKDLPIYENPSHIRKNILTKAEARKLGLSVLPKDNYHGLGKDLYIKAITNLNNPKVIFKIKNSKDYLILTTLKDSKGNNIIMPIEIETSTNINNLKIVINRIKSIYDKNNLNDYIKRNINQKKFIKVYEKRTRYGSNSRSKFF